jgi:hypothetical protein
VLVPAGVGDPEVAFHDAMIEAPLTKRGWRLKMPTRPPLRPDFALVAPPATHRRGKEGRPRRRDGFVVSPRSSQGGC